MSRSKNANPKPRGSKSSLASGTDPAALDASAAQTAATEKKAPPQGSEIHLVSATAPSSAQTTGSKAISRVSAAGISDEQIRERAYRLYLERGGEHGRHDDDWYRAEAELKVLNLK
jgi:Protein of unknown function (DUF2934)